MSGVFVVASKYILGMTKINTNTKINTKTETVAITKAKTATKTITKTKTEAMTTFQRFPQVADYSMLSPESKTFLL